MFVFSFLLIFQGNISVTLHMSQKQLLCASHKFSFILTKYKIGLSQRNQSHTELRKICLFCRLWIMRWVQMMTMNMQKKRKATSVQCVWMFISTHTCVTLAIISSVSPAYGLLPKTTLQALPAHCVGQLFPESFSRQVTCSLSLTWLSNYSDYLFFPVLKILQNFLWESLWKSYTA